MVYTRAQVETSYKALNEISEALTRAWITLKSLSDLRLTFLRIRLLPKRLRSLSCRFHRADKDFHVRKRSWEGYGEACKDSERNCF